MSIARYGRGAARHAAGLALAGMLATAAGCASPPAETASAGARGAVNTGTFPNLNVPPAMATEQFTNKTLQSHIDEVEAARQNQAAETSEAAAEPARAAANQARLDALNSEVRGVRTPTDAEVRAEQERLRRLRENHGQATLNAIESR